MGESRTRHADIATLNHYLENGTQGAFAIDGSPIGVLTLDPIRRVLGLRFPASGTPPDTNHLTHVEFRSVLDGGEMFHLFLVSFETDFKEVHALLCSIADRVQLDHEEFTEAVEATLANLDAILQRRTAPTIEQQIGLIGELLVLHALAIESSLDDAVNTWLGPIGEEHDFRLSDLDLEVKTTRGERRVHWISGLAQLQRNPDRALSLASIQLTAAGAANGWTLPDVVDRLRALDPNNKRFEERLQSTIFRDARREMLTRKWMLRSAPTVYDVDDDFPSLTADRLARAAHRADLIVDVRYQIDVHPLPTSTRLASICDTIARHWT